MSDFQDRPLIFALRRCALDDGPGIRTTVFLKGCPLGCTWCHNPESIDPGTEIAFYPDRCINCSECRQACPNGAVIPDPAVRINRRVCQKCGRCAEACPSLALQKIGEYYPVSRLLEILKRDLVFYELSGGGITFSGGEPMLYMDYVSSIISVLKAEGIQVALETSGYFDFACFAEKILPYLDLIFYDLKFIDSSLHKQYTGRENHRILANFARLVKETGLPVIPRTPLVPGITAAPANLARIAAFLQELGGQNHSLLPYNPGGASKQARLGRGCLKRSSLNCC